MAFSNIGRRAQPQPAPDSSPSAPTHPEEHSYTLNSNPVYSKHFSASVWKYSGRFLPLILVPVSGLFWFHLLSTFFAFVCLVAPACSDLVCPVLVVQFFGSWLVCACCACLVSQTFAPKSLCVSAADRWASRLIDDPSQPIVEIGCGQSCAVGTVGCWSGSAGIVCFEGCGVVEDLDSVVELGPTRWGRPGWGKRILGAAAGLEGPSGRPRPVEGVFATGSGGRDRFAGVFATVSDRWALGEWGREGCVRVVGSGRLPVRRGSNRHLRRVGFGRCSGGGLWFPGPGPHGLGAGGLPRPASRCRR